MMSRITVVADSATGSVMLSERVGVADFDSKHFRAQLLERVSWALGDAHVAEQADPGTFGYSFTGDGMTYFNSTALDVTASGDPGRRMVRGR